MEPGRKSESESESESKSKSKSKSKPKPKSKSKSKSKPKPQAKPKPKPKPKRAPTGRSAFEREASRDETSACSPSAGAGDAPPIARLARVRETKSFYM
ncbi:hypothetical protein AQ914_17015 [Burkholderia pseudomallei]|nr:hypothetical protein AQ914_17015 [Burkholderia pseudomallei]